MTADASGPAAARGRGSVVVIGSANVDVSVTTRTLPRPGETAFGDTSMVSVGGKGANQAVAAAACGAPTDFVARIGGDAFGRMVAEQLQQRGVRTGQIRALPEATTGLAAIYVDHAAQNCIVVVPGANARLLPADVEALESLIAGAALVVLQCEIPMQTVYRSVELAARHGTPVILNPAPFPGLELARLAGRVTYLVPNETEAGQILGQTIDTPDAAARGAQQLVRQGFACAIITLGAHGCVASDAQGVRHFPAPPVNPIDTTGAGDAFVGCLAAALAAGHAVDTAIRRAILYSALSTTRRGALVSYPTAAEFNDRWARG